MVLHYEARASLQPYDIYITDNQFNLLRAVTFPWLNRIVVDNAGLLFELAAGAA